MSDSKPLIQFSVAELVVVLTIGTLVGGSMWAPNILLQLVMVLVLLLPLVFVTMALIGKDSWRIFSIGFVVFALGYFTAGIVIKNQSLSLPNSHQELPTDYLWSQLYESIVQRVYFKDGKPISEDLEPKSDEWGNVTDKNGNYLGNLNAKETNARGSFGGGGGVPTPGGPPVKLRSIPWWETFQTIGHLLWMLTFGYLGGKFAVGFQRFQHNQETSPTTGE